jgi:hypothetical protein
MLRSTRRKRCAICGEAVAEERVEVQSKPYGRRVSCHRSCFDEWFAPYYRATYVSAPMPLELEEHALEARNRS